MADIAMIYRPAPTLIGTIELDATISETHTRSAQVTDHPVERGANVTDHVRIEPDGLVIEGMVSNTPLSFDQIKRYVRAGGVEIETTNFDETPRGVRGYAERAYERLREIMDAGTVITVVTALRTYDNMVLQSLSVPVTVQSGDALRFTATFKQVVLVSNKITTVDTSTPRGKAKQAKGPKAPKAATPKQEEYSSVLSQITGSGEVSADYLPTTNVRGVH